MRWIDIFSAALSNLWRRKLRSALTMLGVVIGTAAIVVTISLGHGAEKAIREDMERNNNLTIIEVYPNWGSAEGDVKPTSMVSKLDDSTIRSIRSIKGVDAITPIVSFYVNGITFGMATGKYSLGWVNLMGVFADDINKFVTLSEGRFMQTSGDRMEFIMSPVNMVEFRRPKDPYEWIDTYTLIEQGKPIPLPNVNWLSAKFKFSMIWETRPDDNPESDPIINTEEIDAKMVGVIKPERGDYTFGYGAFVDYKWLKNLAKDNKKLFKELGGTSPMDSYDRLIVKVKSVDDVAGVLIELREMGVQPSSPLMWIDTYMQAIQTTQGFLGAIGAISMLVAALSIANTMMMSIYERTREIGVMKVLGCKMSNIRMLFLSEAAFIGFFGGLAGMILSFSFSYALNNVQWLNDILSKAMSSMSFSGKVQSVIPMSLAATTWSFVTLIAITSGFYPAQRAMQLSSLEAIRSSN